MATGQPAEVVEGGDTDGSGKDSSVQGLVGRGPAWELVVARHSEDLAWLSQVPDFWQVVVYNKVPSLSASVVVLQFTRNGDLQGPYKSACISELRRAKAMADKSVG